MFVLRRITSEQLTSNTLLGESYILIDSERNPKKYAESLDILKILDFSDITGFISYKEGSELMPLYVKSTYFIMVSNGRTFEGIR